MGNLWVIGPRFPLRSAVVYGILRTACRVSLIHLNGFMPHETGIAPLQRCDRGGFVNEYGMWRSLVAHLTGGQGVAGSNPVIPTIFLTKTQIAVFNSKQIALG